MQWITMCFASNQRKKERQIKTSMAYEEGKKDTKYLTYAFNVPSIVIPNPNKIGKINVQTNNNNNNFFYKLMLLYDFDKIIVHFCHFR